MLGSRDQVLAGFAAGVDDYLAKPFDLDELLARVQVWVRTSRRVQAHGERERAITAELRAIMQALSDGLLVVDGARRVRYANPLAERLLGTTPLFGEGLDALWERVARSAPDADAVRVAHQAALGELAERPMVVYRLGDPPVDVRASYFAVDSPAGREPGLGIVLTDLTAERELQRTKDELVSVVSHELRTPLASLVGFAELLLARDFPEAERREFLTVMLQEGRRLGALINDFLDLQRMDSTRQHVVPVPTDLGALLAHAAASAGADPLRPIAVDLPAPLPAVHADPDRVLQVLQNLLANARKFSPNGGTIRVSARQLGSSVEVAVADEGLGIPPAALPRLFEKFYRVDNSDRRDIKGTGLGLAIVQKIVEAHGGTVQVESAGLGRGSTFRFTLPVAGAVPPAARPDAPSPAVPVSARSGDVLLIEDDPAYATWLCQALGDQGYAVRSAAGAEEALRLIAQAPPAVVLLDLRLDGDMDGWDLLAVLRNRPETQALPVVVVSAVDEPSRALALGVEDYFVKPVSQARLLAALRGLGLDPTRKVLVVEDSPQAQLLVGQHLAGAGLAAAVVGSGEEALAALDAAPDSYGAMVLDLGLPGIDGFAVLEALRERPAVRDLRVVVFTGRDLSAAEKRYLTEGVSETVRKGNGVPIGEAVARALRHRPDPSGETAQSASE